MRPSVSPVLSGKLILKCLARIHNVVERIERICASPYARIDATLNIAEFLLVERHEDAISSLRGGCDMSIKFMRNRRVRINNVNVDWLRKPAI